MSRRARSARKAMNSACAVGYRKFAVVAGGGDDLGSAPHDTTDRHIIVPGAGARGLERDRMQPFVVSAD